MSTVGFSKDTSLALMADLQFMEPYASASLNRKFKNILLPGFYAGFKPLVGSGLNLLISSESGISAASIDTNGYQITVQQTSDITVPLAAGKSYIIALQADYSVGVITSQVKADSTNKAAQIVVLDSATTLASNQILLCTVTIPAGTTQITAAMISTTSRVDRLIGISLNDSITLDSSTTGASSKAVKVAYESAVSYADKTKAALGKNSDITSLNALTSLGNTAITAAGKVSFTGGIASTTEAHFSYGAYTDPAVGKNYAIKASQGIAVSGASLFNDSVTLAGGATVTNGLAVTGGITADTANFTGQVTGAVPQRTLPATYSTGAWFKIATIANVGSNAGWLSLLLTSGNYGAKVMGTDVISLTGRGMPATGTAFTAALAASYVNHTQIIPAGNYGAVIGIVPNITSGVYVSFDFYIKSPGWWSGAKVSITGGTGYTYYGDNLTPLTTEPEGIQYITPYTVMTTGLTSYDMSGGAVSAKSLSLGSALSIANGGTSATTAAAARTNLGLGSAATYNTGTSGATVPLLNTANTWSGAQKISSMLTMGDEIQTTSANGLRLVANNLGMILRNDGTNFYLLRASENNGYGTWTTDRPFSVSMSTGAVTMSSGQTLSGNTKIYDTLTLANALSVANGGTGASDVVNARKNLGLGSAALMTSTSAAYNALSGLTTEAANTAQLVALRNASALTGQVNTFAQTQSFAAGMALNTSPGGGVTNNGIFNGPADGFSYSAYNTEIRTWYSVGIRDTCNNATNIVFNARTGDMLTKGTINTSGLSVSGTTKTADISSSGTISAASMKITGDVSANNITASQKISSDSGYFYSNDNAHYLFLGRYYGEDTAVWATWGGIYNLINTSTKTVTTSFNNGDISTTGSLTLSGDNCMMVMGKNSDLGFVKKPYAGSKLMIGNGNSFIVSKADAVNISPSANQTDLFSVSPDGTVNVTGNTLSVVGSGSSNLIIGSGPSDVYMLNSISGKYLQLADDGYLKYNGNKVYHEGNLPRADGFGYNSKVISPQWSDSSRAWVKIATFNLPQVNSAYIRITGGDGYNEGAFGQASFTEIVLRGGNWNPINGITAVAYIFGDGIFTQFGWVSTSGDNYELWCAPLDWSQNLLIEGRTSSGVLMEFSDDASSSQPSGFTSGQMNHIPLGTSSNSIDTLFIDKLSIGSKLIGKDTYHYLDMTSDAYTLCNYNGQFYFTGANTTGTAQLSYSGNIKGTQWGGWLSDYLTNNFKNTAGLSSNTWWRCKSTGLIIQCGTNTVPGVGYTPITFPIAFPSVCLSVSNTVIRSSSVGADCWSSIRNKSKTGFEAGTDGSGSTWIAIGY